MPKVALIADIHGNAVALRAVVDAIELAEVDQILCLGDVATLGPRPREVLDILRTLDCVCIRGNHEAFLLEPALTSGYTDAPVIVDSVTWCRRQLRDSNLEFLRSFPPNHECGLDSGTSMFMTHGTPRSDIDDLLSTTPTEEVDSMLEGCGTMLVASGHTHIQMLRQHRGRLLLNPGSVGLPFETYVAGGVPTVLAHAEYAIVELVEGHLGVTLHRIPLEPGMLRDAVKASELPLREMLLQQYL